MEFTEYTCPICQKRFVKDDDVVVCPECGAPHHRECYESNGNCFYEDRHAPGFSFDKADKAEDEQTDETDSEYITCPNCHAENEKTFFYCGKCGYPLNTQDRSAQDNTQQNQYNGQRTAQGTPFGFGSAGNPAYDPLMGLNSEDEIADNVKVGEAAKFIGKSTPYFLTVFDRIKRFGSKRFNFSAFVFTGAYFIYRKMYVPGIILMLAVIGINLGSTAIIMNNQAFFKMSSTDQLNQLYNGTLKTEEITVLAIYFGLSILDILIRVFSGLFVNKLYYRHCTKQINRIKAEHNGVELNKALETKGGVNLPMAISFFASNAVIYMLCRVFISFNSLGG